MKSTRTVIISRGHGQTTSASGRLTDKLLGNVILPGKVTYITLECSNKNVGTPLQLHRFIDSQLIVIQNAFNSAAKLILPININIFVVFKTLLRLIKVKDKSTIALLVACANEEAIALFFTKWLFKSKCVWIQYELFSLSRFMLLSSALKELIADWLNVKIGQSMDGWITMKIVRDQLNIDTNDPSHCKIDFPIEFSSFNFSSLLMSNPQDRFSLTYMGSICAKSRNPGKIFAILNLASEYVKLNVSVYLKNPLPARLKTNFQTYSSIRFYPCVTPKESREILSTTDVSLSFGNASPRFVPSKIFELMELNLPIIHFSSIDDDPCKYYLREYPLHLLVPIHKMSEQHAALMVADYIKSISSIESHFSTPKNMPPSLYQMNNLRDITTILDKFFFDMLELRNIKLSEVTIGRIK